MTYELGPLPEPSLYTTSNEIKHTKNTRRAMFLWGYSIGNGDIPLYTADKTRSYAAAEVARAVAAERDCRTCRHYTTASGGCVNVLRCVEGSHYQRAGVRRCWDEA